MMWVIGVALLLSGAAIGWAFDLTVVPYAFAGMAVGTGLAQIAKAWIGRRVE